ncbi:MAG: hypothetical protein Q3988_06160 [Gemella sp.]|nr:hypothetical protein [Gemella sp.]
MKNFFSLIIIGSITVTSIYYLADLIETEYIKDNILIRLPLIAVIVINFLVLVISFKNFIVKTFNLKRELPYNRKKSTGILRFLVSIMMSIIMLYVLFWLETESQFKDDIMVRLVIYAGWMVCFNFIAAEVKSYYKSVKNKKN